MTVRLVLVPLLAVAGAVLVVSGAAKLRGPADARQAFRRLGIPREREAVAALSLVELAAGVAALVAPVAAVGAAVALLYLAFAAAGERQRRLHGVVSCGCLGAIATEPSRIHAVLNLGLAACAALAALAGTPAAASYALGHPGAALALVAGIATGTLLVVAALAYLPVTLTAYRGADEPA